MSRIGKTPVLIPEKVTVDFNGLTGRVAIKEGTNDRDNMAIQIMNSHGFDQTHNLSLIHI